MFFWNAGLNGMLNLTQWNSEILIRGRSAGSDPQRNVAFHLLENEFENVELTHGTRLGMDGKALG